VGTLETSPTALTFAGLTAVGQRSAALALLVSNVGSGPVTIASIAVEGDFTVSGTCPALAAGSSCTLSVTFAPTATGLRAGMLTIRSNASNAILVVALEGRGAPLTARATLGVTQLDFGNHFQFTASPARAVSLTNTGLAPLTLAQISVTPGFLQTNDCPTTLQPAQACQIQVRMFGTFVGPLVGELRVASNAEPATALLSGRTCMLYSTLRARFGVLTCQ
jgi:hypothetical protein